MKTLYESLLDDLDVLSDKADESLLDSVKKWINSNYHVVELKISENTTEDVSLQTREGLHKNLIILVP